jgi:hypothetical protein
MPYAHLKLLSGHVSSKSLAKALGRNPDTDVKAVGQVCDKLDAVAALAGVPLLALSTVREETGRINHKAWCNPQRAKVIDYAVHHKSTPHEFDRMRKVLRSLNGVNNHAAWGKVVKQYSHAQTVARVTT